jgi:hypothetical protein
MPVARARGCPRPRNAGGEGTLKWLLVFILLGGGGLILVVPSLLYSPCRPSLETQAIGSCRAYSCAQSMYHRNDWDADGQLEYASSLVLLHTEKDSTGTPINLLDAAFADARGLKGTPKHGYLFREMKTIGGQPIDWTQDCALCAIPVEYGRTGYRSFIISTNGTVFGKDQGEGGTFVDDYPADPGAAGWCVAE